MRVGDYVRTKEGNIFKIIGGNQDNWDIDIDYSRLEHTEELWLELYRYNDNGSWFDNKNIIKSSPNIIDLIEVGDIVINQVGEIIVPYSSNIDELKDYWNICKKPIKSIVTHEMFENMEYRIGE